MMKWRKSSHRNTVSMVNLHMNGWNLGQNWDPRFRSLSRSNARPRFGNFNQPIECYYCHHMGHTANNCFKCQNRNFPCRQPNQGRRNNFRNSKWYPNYRTDTRYRTANAPQCRVNFSELPILIYVRLHCDGYTGFIGKCMSVLYQDLDSNWWRLQSSACHLAP